MLRRLEDKGMIDSYPVYLDSPMALDATDLYKKYQDELRPEILNGEFISPIATGRFHAVRSGDESMLLCMDDSPKIVISAAGMLTGGRVLHHLKKRLSESKNGVLFVGYQVPGSKGYLLKNGLSRIRLHHQDIDVEAQIFSMESLSAHADSDQIMDWLKKFRRPPSRIFLNHGENISRQALAYRIQHELNMNCELPEQGEEYILGKLK
jgi:metallo-beta-lactamase family protein